MQPWQHDLLIEKVQLAKKMDALEDFMQSAECRAFNMDSLEELGKQLDAMGQYYDILCTRVHRFESEF